MFASSERAVSGETSSSAVLRAGREPVRRTRGVPRPTGKLLRTGAGSDLILNRTFRAGIEDVWASETEPEHTARWFGP
jgi:hypothetical protein